MYGLKSARVMERLGRMGDARSVSLVCIHTHDIPDEFSAEALAQAEAAGPVTLAGREDLRGIPLVTIDGEDARDFDDAVWAEPDGDGHRLIVAIADVAHYVPSGSPLDRTAWDRGNSVYFPDRVVPMLPEALSNGWCSLRPQEERGCLFVEMQVDAEGRKTGAPLRPRADALGGAADLRAGAGGAGPRRRLDLPIPALYAAFRALLGARQTRGTLDLDLPERKVVLDADGQRRRHHAAPAPGQPPADRGVHGAGQRGRGRGAGGAAAAAASTASTRRRRTRSWRRCGRSCTAARSACRRRARCIRATWTAC